MRRTAAVLAALALALVTAAPAHAATSSRKDGNDTLGPLDLKRVTLETTGTKMSVTFTTHDAFATSNVSGLSALGVDFEVGRDKIRGMAVKSDTSGRLVSSICTYRSTGNLSGSACSRVKVKRLSTTSVRVTVARAKIDKGATTYRWRAGAVTSTYGGTCSSINPRCIDRLPDSNRFLRFTTRR